MRQRLKSYDKRLPGKFEMAFSFGVIVIVTILGLLILVGAFRISPAHKLTLGLILIGYGFVRFWMLKSRYQDLRRKEEGLGEPHKEE
jgi:hypothetical protein